MVRNGTVADETAPSHATATQYRAVSMPAETAGPGTATWPAWSCGVPDVQDVQRPGQFRQLRQNGCELARGATGPRDQHDVDPVLPRQPAGRLTQQPLAAVARHGRADATRRDDRDTRGSGSAIGSHMHHGESAGALAPTAQNRRDVATLAQPVDCDGGHGDQALSDARPRRRRFLTIARPARVAMRARKPCFVDRRRLLG